MNNNNAASQIISLMSVKSLRASRMRNSFVAATIILASALLMTILMFAAGQEQQLKKELSHRQQVVYYNLTAGQVEALKSDTRVAFQIQIKTGALSQMDGFDVLPCYVNALSDAIQVGELEDGRLPEAENEIAVQAAMLEKMGTKPQTGSSVCFTFYDGSTETFTVSGILKGSSMSKQFPVFLSHAYAENGRQLKNIPYEVYAKLHNADQLSAEACREQMLAIGRDAEIERKYIIPSKAFLESLSVDTQSVIFCGLVGAVIMLACVLVIYGVFYLSVVGRIHQFGQLRTIGMTRKQIRKFIAREGGILYLLSAPAGILIGGIAGYLIIPDGFDIHHTLFIAGLVLVIVYSITMLSIRRPARLAAAVSPMEALRYMPQDGMKRTAGRKLCRKLTPLGMGIMNFSKNRKKAVITFASLALGGILFMGAATYMSSFHKADFARQGFFADAEFHISYSASAIELNENGLSGLQAEAPLHDGMIRQISGLDGVKSVTPVKNLGIRFDYPKNDLYGDNDMVCLLTEQETEALSAYLEAGSADYDKLMSGRYVLVADNNTAQEIYGWKFAVGDAITLHYYDGSKISEKEVLILGLLSSQYVLERNGIEGWFFMPEQAVSDWLSYDTLNTDLLVSTQPEKEAAVGELLTQLVSEKPELLLETLAERRVAYNQNANRIFGAISGLAIFIMAFSILSMMNTLITNIITRKQELAMLESIGMSKGQIRKMLLGESLLLVFAAVGVTMTIGTLCGCALTRMLHNMGAFYMAFRFPAAFAFAYAGVLTVVPLVITFVSMRSFSKEALVERLKGTEN